MKRVMLKATVLTAIADDPFAYGRIIRDVNGKLGENC